ncbi:membrane protein insertion efficiency factor YidD [Clostridium guangxiense]|uniref:membrane protein insertion efficiency factor YidD n=2 Tax=Clostridium TaxID=1485 RepID=UPI001E4A8008|nr:membrane protein insertion efficiency factor YidD [Clostridium guangxiense]MCD2346888.1 membrane protein insertion efficiency factor YidD [Clostridium guangxiense]
MMKKIIIKFIEFYRKCSSSPMFRGLSSAFFIRGQHVCKYSPTCSEYAIEAVEKYGALKGSLMAIKRILKCNPFSKGGYDPVK